MSGERKEGVVFAARPFAAKISNALTVVVVFLTLTVGGIYDITNKISEFEVQGALEVNPMPELEVIANAQAAIDGANLVQARLALIIAMALLPAICSSVAYFLVKRKYPIDEAMYDNMLVEIDARKVETI